MSEKQEIIRQMMDMQQKFIEIEHQGKFSAEEYYDSDGESELARSSSVITMNWPPGWSTWPTRKRAHVADSPRFSPHAEQVGVTQVQ